MVVPGLQRGDFDFAMNGLEMTPDRVKAARTQQFLRQMLV
jgi:type II secretory pathway component PulC